MRICVFSSSSAAVDAVYHEAARALGTLLAQRGHTLVYGGCHVGTMGELARATSAAGGEVVGILPRALMERGLGYLEADSLIVAETMAERKALMEQQAEGIIALAGGFGTLDELAQALTLKQLGQWRGGIVLLNTAGFYDRLLAHFEWLYAQRFARVELRASYQVAAQPEAALAYLEQYHEMALPGKWL
jgi:hypothetical protein